MKLNEYLGKLQSSPIFRSVLPADQGALYPLFSVKNGTLCIHLLTHKTEITNNGLKVYHPEFYLSFTYPAATLLEFNCLSFDARFTSETRNFFEIIGKPSTEETTQKKEELGKIIYLADKLLAEWDEKKAADINEYNSAYLKLLTEKQKEVFEKLLW